MVAEEVQNPVGEKEVAPRFQGAVTGLYVGSISFTFRPPHCVRQDASTEGA